MKEINVTYGLLSLARVLIRLCVLVSILSCHVTFLIYIPQADSVVEIMNDLGAEFYIMTNDLLVRSETIHSANPTRKIPIDDRTKLTISQLQLEREKPDLVSILDKISCTMRSEDFSLPECCWDSNRSPWYWLVAQRRPIHDETIAALAVDRQWLLWGSQGIACTSKHTTKAKEIKNLIYSVTNGELQMISEAHEK